MRPSTLPRPLFVAALLALAPATAAHAQWVTGVGEDAIVLPRGTVRTTVGGIFGGFEERFSSSADGAPTGGSRPYGGEFAFDGSGLRGLASLDAAVRTIDGTLGDPGVGGVTLGAFRVAADARRAELPVRFDVGVGGRLQLFAAGAYVQTRTAVGLIADPTAAAANVGANPALSDDAAAAANAALVAGLRDAAATLESQLAACGAAGGGGACADPAAAATLRDALTSAAVGIGAAYAADPGRPLVPAASTPLADAVDARVAALIASARAFGATSLAPDARPRHAPTPISPGALFALADTGSAALGLPPLRESRRYGISDVEVGARVRILDPLRGRIDVADPAPGTRVRLALTALVRLPTGEPDDPLDPLDVGTGDGQTDVEVGVATDVLRGRRFVGSLAARYGVQLAHELDRAVPIGGAFSTATAVAAVRRDLGDYLELELTPRYALNDYLTLGVHYRFRAKGEDAYEPLAVATPDVDDAAVAALGLGTDTRQHVVGGGIVFSTLPAYAQGRARWPVDVALRRTITAAGAGRLAERYTRDELMLRVYLTPFGRP